MSCLIFQFSILSKFCIYFAFMLSVQYTSILILLCVLIRWSTKGISTSLFIASICIYISQKQDQEIMDIFKGKEWEWIVIQDNLAHRSCWKWELKLPWSLITSDVKRGTWSFVLLLPGNKIEYIHSKGRKMILWCLFLEEIYCMRFKNFL